MKKTEKAKLVAQFLAKKIQQFDALVFKKTVPITILTDSFDTDRVVACFCPEEKLLWRMLGLKGEYKIFQNHLGALFGKEAYLISIAAHEVRHRFQLIKKSSLIKEHYLTESKLVDEEVLLFIQRKVGLRNESSDHYPFEFDAALIQDFVHSLASKKTPSSEELLSIITCTPKTVGKIQRLISNLQ